LPLDAYQLKRARSRLTLGCIPDEERSTALQHEGGASSSGYLEQKFHLPVECVAQGLGTQGDVMTTLQAICLGAMLAWTPSLVVLAALLLREAPLEELERDPS
jgi:hypothetical protein